MNTIEEAARRLTQLRSAGVDTPSESATRPATALLEVGTGEHEVTAAGPEGLSGVREQSAPERPAPSVTLTPPPSPPAKQSLQPAARKQPPIHRISSERWRMPSSLLLSLLIHGLLLSLTFGGHGVGLPGFGFPWQERRVEVPELRVVLVPARVTPPLAPVNSVAGPTQPVAIEPPVAGGRAATPPASPAPLRGRGFEIVPSATPERNAVAPAVPAKASTRGESVPLARAKVPKAAAIDVPPSGRPKLVVRPVATGPDVITAAPSVLSPETVMPAHRDAGDQAHERIAQDVREEAAALAKQAEQLEATRVAAAKREADLRDEAARLEAARVEAKREEAALVAAARMEAQQEAARQEAARQEAAVRIEAAQRAAAQLEADRLLATRQEVARVEAARATQLEAERQKAVRLEDAARVEAARRAAAQLEEERRPAVRQEPASVEAARTAQPEAQRQEATGQEPVRPEAARQEVARKEPARQEPARQERARQAAAPQEVGRGEAEKEEEERREARRRAIGRQLDEEAAKREAASNAARQLPLSLSTARRARLWGRAHPNIELVHYAEGWARKIQFNTPVAAAREVAKQPHRHPTVTVAIRSDGSVESVTFVISSGVAQVDDAIRRIVQSHEHYQAFSPVLAREYDVIEIRRTWHFDDAVRLQ